MPKPFFSRNMSAWTRLVRFVGKDGQTRLGQPVDASVDVGTAVFSGKDVEVNVIDGEVYSGTVSNEKDTIKKVRGFHLASIIHPPGGAQLMFTFASTAFVSNQSRRM